MASKLMFHEICTRISIFWGFYRSLAGKSSKSPTASTSCTDNNGLEGYCAEQRARCRHDQQIRSAVARQCNVASLQLSPPPTKQVCRGSNKGSALFFCRLQCRKTCRACPLVPHSPRAQPATASPTPMPRRSKGRGAERFHAVLMLHSV